MKIVSEITLADFEAWSGARGTLQHIIDEGGCDQLEAVLEDLYPDGMTDTQLNDILWFEPEWCYEMAGVSDPNAEDDEEDDEDEDEEEGLTDEEQEAFDEFCGQFDGCEGCPYKALETMDDCQSHWKDEVYST